jgi:hypothetical protein
LASRSVCPLCRARRGKRLCPAKGEEICAHCCGTRRRVEIRCPDDCVYLAGAHAGGWEGRETERRRDARRLAPFVQDLSEEQAYHLFRVLRAVTDLRQRGVVTDDRRLDAALSTLHKTFETRAKGVLYEHPAEDLRAQPIIAELGEVLSSGDENGLGAPSDGDQLAIVAALHACVVAVIAEGGEPATFLDTAERLAAEMGAPSPSAASPLIIEP